VPIASPGSIRHFDRHWPRRRKRSDCASPPKGLIVLVTWDGEHWTLPGGTREAGERLEQTLAREVREEACTHVLGCRYLGCQHVTELDGGREAYYQTRFWARVELESFTSRHEMIARRLVPPDQFLATLFWGGERTAGRILLARSRGRAASPPLARPIPPWPRLTRARRCRGRTMVRFRAAEHGRRRRGRRGCHGLDQRSRVAGCVVSAV
jgi:ADP-ribose pyrophosphatase YjhB (NUDIX family)